MTTSFALLILSVAACAWLVARAMRGQRKAMAERRHLLAEATGLLSGPSTVIGLDGYPIVTGQIQDGRKVKIDLIADTLVTRRLPQLWLRVTLYDASPLRPAIGMLTRPTGSEYYSLVHVMPHWMTPPRLSAPMLMRGDGTATPDQTGLVLDHFERLFNDQSMKEAVISQRGVRIVRQAAQGARGAHMLLRQSHFAIATVPAADIGRAISMAIALVEVLKIAEPVCVTEAA